MGRSVLRTLLVIAILGSGCASNGGDPGGPDTRRDGGEEPLPDAIAPPSDAATPIPDASTVDPDAAPPPIDAAPPPIDTGTVIDPDASIAVDPDAAIAPDPDAAVTTGVPPAIDGQIAINELMAFNAITVLDDTGVASDWVELYNPTTVAIPLAGYGLTDDFAMPARGVVPAGVTLPAGGHLVLWLDHAPEKGPRHLGFRLRREGGSLGLTRPDGSDIDRVSYGAQEVDFSAARTPDGSSHWRIEWHPSPASANPDGPGQPMGLEDPLAAAELIPAAGDLSARILDDSVLLQLGITISPAGMIALANSPFIDVPATLIFDGRSYGPVGIRLKGQNSFQSIDQKPSLRINIDQYVPRAKFFGLKDLTLNNMDNDFSMMHERLAYKVARQAGLPASRANHALVAINGEPYGLYVNVETVKRRMLSHWFSNFLGPLFEATDVDLVPGDVAGYEHESGPDDDSVIAGLAAALTIADPDAALAAAATYADLAEIRRFWAMCSIVGQFDSFPYSNPGDDTLVYVNPASGKLVVIPWGMDETFYSGSYDVLQVYSVLAEKCMASSDCFQDYVDQTWELLGMIEDMDLGAMRTAIAAQIAPHVAADTHKPYTTAMVVEYQNAMGWFISERGMHIASMLPPPSL